MPAQVLAGLVSRRGATTPTTTRGAKHAMGTEGGDVFVLGVQALRMCFERLVLRERLGWDRDWGILLQGLVPARFSGVGWDKGHSAERLD